MCAARRRPRSPHGVHELLEVEEARCGRERGGPGVLLAQQSEHHPQLVLGGPPDHLDRFERGARLLRALCHQAPAHPGLDGDHREGVGDDVVQLAGDAHPLLADLQPGALGLGGSLALGLLGQPGHVMPGAATLSPINHPAASGRKPTSPPAAERPGPFVVTAYRSAAPKTAAAASTAGSTAAAGRQRPRYIQTRRAPGSPAATRHPSPSARPRRRWPVREEEVAIGGRTRSPGRTPGRPDRAPVRARASTGRSPGQSRPRRRAPSGRWRAQVAAAR